MGKRSKSKSTPNDEHRIRDFLKDFAVPILTCACAAFTAYQANQISQLQAAISKNAERPTIEVVEHSFLDNFESEMEDSIDITILDGKYDNYQSDIITFLICEYDDINEDFQFVPFKTFEIPVSSYYDTHIKSQSIYGKVETMYTLQNSTALKNLRSLAKEKYESIAGRTFTTSVESYLRIAYTNLLDEPETVYYRLDGNSIGQVARINREYGEAQFEKWRDMTQNSLQIAPDDTHRRLFQLLAKVDETWDLYKE